MKFIVVGLGNFGAALAISLTDMGHEVIGVDKRLQKVDFLKDKITFTVSLDATDVIAAGSLPIKEVDVVIVAIGEEEGASILATAVMKQHRAKRIISRAITPVEHMVLEAMGIDEIVHPEEDAARKLAKKLNIKGIIEAFELAGSYNIVEVKVPNEFVGKKLEELKLSNKYNLLVLTIIKTKKINTVLNMQRSVQEINGIATAGTKLCQGDILVIFGDINNIKRMMQKYGL